MMLFGSSACLISRISDSASPCSSRRNLILSRPTPCSPVQVPSSASARCTMRLVQALRPRARSLGSSGSTRSGEVEVAVADMADDVVRQPRPSASAIRSASMHSARREIGTQMSVRHGAAARAGLHCRRSRRRGAPSTAACAPRACVAHSKSSPPCSRGDRLHRLGLLLRRRPRCRGTPSAASAPRAGRACECLLTARTAFASSSSQRAIGTPTGWSGSRSCTARVDAREVADRRAHRLGQRVELQRDLGDHAERAFAADEQARQVVAGAGLLARACRCG